MTTSVSPRAWLVLSAIIIAAAITVPSAHTPAAGLRGTDQARGPADRLVATRPRQLAPLFAQVVDARSDLSTVRAGRIRLATVTISDRTLASRVIPDADAHLLNLFSDFQVVAFRNRTETRQRGDYSWFGSVPGEESGQVIITVVDGKLGAYVFSRRRMFMVLPLHDEYYEVVEVVDPPVFEEGAERAGDPAPVDAPVTVTGVETTRITRAVGTGPIDTGGVMRWFNLAFALTDGNVPALERLNDDGSVIDILIFYSRRAAARHESLSHLLVYVQLMVDEVNQHFARSGVATRLNLLFNTALASDDLVETGTLSDDVDAWEDLASINALRDAVAADMVAFVSGSALKGGIHRKVSRFMILGAQAHPWELAHEVGHAMDLKHDWPRCYGEATPQNPCETPDDWSTAHVGNHGHWDLRDNSRIVRSVMAYPDVCGPLGIPDASCELVPRFSNPNQTYEGVAFGIPEGQPYPSDEALHLNEKRFEVANRRRSVCRLQSSTGC